MRLLLPVLFFPTQFYLPSVGYLPRSPRGLVIGFTALMFLSTTVSTVGCFLLARRCAFSRAGCYGWSLFGLLWGPAGLLLMLSLYEWPARVACPQCHKLRVVTRDTCEHCGAAHAVPPGDGTEVIEPTEMAQQAVLVGG
jgi:hypothetical protein